MANLCSLFFVSTRIIFIDAGSVIFNYCVFLSIRNYMRNVTTLQYILGSDCLSFLTFSKYFNGRNDYIKCPWYKIMQHSWLCAIDISYLFAGLITKVNPLETPHQNHVCKRDDQQMKSASLLDFQAVHRVYRAFQKFSQLYKPVSSMLRPRDTQGPPGLHMAVLRVPCGTGD